MSTEEKNTAFEVRQGIRFARWCAPFWEATKRGELSIQRCKDCRNEMFPPRLYCTSCMSQNTEWVKASGKGKIYSYSVAYEYPPTRVARFLSVPYIIALVDLEEGVRMITTIVGCKPEDVKIGSDVEVEFQDIGEGVALPRFKPAVK